MAHQTSAEWEQFLGQQVRTIRLRQNMTQLELAERSGISRSALASLESGKGGNLRTFVTVVNVLGESGWLENLAPAVAISPLQLLDTGKQRQRARRAISGSSNLRRRKNGAGHV